jgi:DNA uptake protein ComE-like DNA-binding protein
MSTTRVFAEVRHCETEPGAARQPAVSETWPIEARTLLAVIAAATAIALFILNPDSGKSRGKEFAAAPNLVLDGNSAPPQVMQALPTFGPAMVRRWVAARTERPFSSLDDARRRVRGLGPASVPQIAPYLRFESSSVSPSDGFARNLATDSKRASIKMDYTAGEPINRLVAAAR